MTYPTTQLSAEGGGMWSIVGFAGHFGCSNKFECNKTYLPDRCNLSGIIPAVRSILVGWKPDTRQNEANHVPRRDTTRDEPDRSTRRPPVFDSANLCDATWTGHFYPLGPEEKERDCIQR
jgi:hypothetical protein